MELRVKDRAAPQRPPSHMAVDRRAWRRVKIPLKVRFVLGEGEEHLARVETISPAEMTLRTNVTTEPGQTAILYIDRVGRFEGTVMSIGDGTIRLRFDIKRARKARIADSLLWLVNRGMEAPPHRRAMRIRQDKAAEAVTEYGDVMECKIVDISITGASVAIMPRPEIGEILTIGRMRGRVVRHHDAGVGMEFIKDESDRNRKNADH